MGTVKNYMTLPPMPDRARAIIEEVAARHNLHPTSLVCRSRSANKVAARYEAMRLIRALDGNKFSLARIGKMFNRDHTTVVHAMAKGESAARSGSFGPFR